MTLFWVLAIISFATLGQATMGFGGGLIAIPLLSLLVGVKDAVMLGLIMQVLVGLLAFRQLSALRWPILIPVVLALIPTTLLGTYLLGVTSPRILQWCLAAFILLFLVKSLFAAESRWVPSPWWGWGASAGAASGLLQGMLGTGGPPLVIYLTEVTEHKDELRVSLLWLLMISNIVRIITVVPTGLIHAKLLPMMGWSVPCILLSMGIGSRLHRYMSETLYRNAILVLLFGSAVSLLLKH